MSKHATTKDQGVIAFLLSPACRKMQVAVVGVLVSLVTAGLIPPDIGIWITTIVSSLVAAGVFALPNKQVVPEAEVVEAQPYYGMNAKG